MARIPPLGIPSDAATNGYGRMSEIVRRCLEDEQLKDLFYPEISLVFGEDGQLVIDETA
jgi:hypothetical protein